MTYGFQKREDENEHDGLMRHVSELAGAISTCWLPGTGSLIFDSTRAGVLLVEMTQAITDVMQPHVEAHYVLNSTAWSLAVALGEIEPGDHEVVMDIKHLVERAVAAIESGKASATVEAQIHKLANLTRVSETK